MGFARRYSGLVYEGSSARLHVARHKFEGFNMADQFDISYCIRVSEELFTEYETAIRTEDLSKLRDVLLAVSSGEEQDMIKRLLPDDLVLSDL